jgi:hypothetical protein
MSIKSILAAALILGSSATLAECVAPEAPSLPDGSSATMQDMIAGQKAVKAYQAENISYMSCVEEQIAAAEASSTTGTKEEKAAAEAAKEKAEAIYNSAVSVEEEVAGQFNTEIREYKAANPS